jgi:hypothetical protein
MSALHHLEGLQIDRQLADLAVARQRTWEKIAELNEAQKQLQASLNAFLE